MSGYKLYVLDSERRIKLAYDFHGADDAAALEESKKHSGEGAIEIWEKSRLVARIERGGEAATG